MKVLNSFAGVSRELNILFMPGYGYFLIKLARIALSKMLLFRL